MLHVVAVQELSLKSPENGTDTYCWIQEGAVPKTKRQTKKAEFRHTHRDAGLQVDTATHVAT